MGCASAGGPESHGHNVDPWEKMNRGIFRFNEGADRWAIEPASRAWSFAVPKLAQQGIKNIYDNAWMPAVIGNHLLQAHPVEAFVEDLPRLILNTTIGLAGLFDVASQVGIRENVTDFGITMGRWGLPPGPYFEIPLLGPSNARDGVGRVVDSFSSPYTYFIPWWSFFVTRGVELMNLRALYAEELAQSKADAFDYYLFRRDAWMQNRRYRVGQARGEVAPSPAEDEDLFYFDDADDADDADDDYEADAIDRGREDAEGGADST